MEDTVGNPDRGRGHVGDADGADGPTTCAQCESGRRSHTAAGRSGGVDDDDRRPDCRSSGRRPASREGDLMTIDGRRSGSGDRGRGHVLSHRGAGHTGSGRRSGRDTAGNGNRRLGRPDYAPHMLGTPDDGGRSRPEPPRRRHRSAQTAGRRRWQLVAPSSSVLNREGSSPFRSNESSYRLSIDPAPRPRQGPSHFTGACGRPAATRTVGHWGHRGASVRCIRVRAASRSPLTTSYPCPLPRWGLPPLDGIGTSEQYPHGALCYAHCDDGFAWHRRARALSVRRPPDQHRAPPGRVGVLRLQRRRLQAVTMDVAYGDKELSGDDRRGARLTQGNAVSL